MFSLKQKFLHSGYVLVLLKYMTHWGGVMSSVVLLSPISHSHGWHRPRTFPSARGAFRSISCTQRAHPLLSAPSAFFSSACAMLHGWASVAKGTTPRQTSNSPPSSPIVVQTGERGKVRDTNRLCWAVFWQRRRRSS